jgi:hypothetical protein
MIPLPSPLSASSIRCAAAAAALAVLAGCSTAPLSFLDDRQVYHPTALNRYPVRVVAIDGASTIFHPQPITTGNHLVTFDAQPVAGFSVPVQKTFAMEIAPCTRYYVAAQRTSPLLQDWTLVVEETGPVSGCDPKRELDKARQAAAEGKQPPLSSSVESTPLAAAGASRTAH